MEILLVEDGLMDARATIEALKSGNIKHRLTLVRDGEEAIDFLLQRDRFSKAPRPDLILLDLGLPDSDGQTLSVWLRSEPALAKVPIIVLTAWPEEVARQTVEAYDLDGYLCKPFELAELVQLIDKTLGKHKII